MDLLEYAVMDIYSRYKDAVILNQIDAHGAVVSLLGILSRLPFTATFIQTDNGPEFLGLFHETVLKLELQRHYIHKQSPNENAVIERSFRTDEKEFFFRLDQRPAHYTGSKTTSGSTITIDPIYLYNLRHLLRLLQKW